MIEAAWWDPFVRLLAAAVYAGAIGLDRELRAKPAGLRTNIVVGVAAAGFGFISEHAFESTRGFDPSRVASEVVSGVGFLGAGAIFASGGKPHGLTTAAALWGSAAAGLSAGVGAFLTGLAVAAITLVALQPLDWTARTVLGGRRREDTHVDLVVRDLPAASAVREEIRAGGIRLADMRFWPFGDMVAMELVLHGTRREVREVLDRIGAREEVAFLSEEAVPRDERGP